MLHSSDEMLQMLISPSLFSRTKKESNCSIEKCNRRCNICKNFLVLSTEFTYHATKRKYKKEVFLTCNTKNIIYLIVCKCCGKQYIGFATAFKERFGIGKSYINTSKTGCGVASHLLNVCSSATCKTEYLQCNLLNMFL